MAWQENALMFWSVDGTNWQKVSDHNRDPLSISVERIEQKNRMADGTLRRYVVAKKRTFTASWTMLPSRRNAFKDGRTGMSTVDDGMAGEEMKQFHDETDGVFKMMLRKGVDEGKTLNNSDLEVVDVMVSDFSWDIEKRGIVDYWTVNITLEEV